MTPKEAAVDHVELTLAELETFPFDLEEFMDGGELMGQLDESDVDYDDDGGDRPASDPDTVERLLGELMDTLSIAVERTREILERLKKLK